MKYGPKTIIVQTPVAEYLANRFKEQPFMKNFKKSLRDLHEMIHSEREKGKRVIRLEVLAGRLHFEILMLAKRLEGAGYKI